VSQKQAESLWLRRNVAQADDFQVARVIRHLPKYSSKHLAPTSAKFRVLQGDINSSNLPKPWSCYAGEVWVN
jgi:hypothetical protein